jgi:hypothetical protein
MSITEAQAKLNYLEYLEVLDMENTKSRKRGNIFNDRHGRMNINCGRGLNWKQTEPQEDMSVVKGTTHRIIVVKSPDKRYFEEAIFVVRDEALGEGGASSETILKEARKIAGAYMGRRKRLSLPPKGRLGHISKMPAPLIAAAGAAVTGVAWLTARLCGL